MYSQGKSGGWDQPGKSSGDIDIDDHTFSLFPTQVRGILVIFWKSKEEATRSSSGESNSVIAKEINSSTYYSNWSVV